MAVNPGYTRRTELRCTLAEMATYGAVIPYDGEIVYVLQNDGRYAIKMGDGTTPLADLPYVVNYSEINTMKEAAQNAKILSEAAKDAAVAAKNYAEGMANVAEINGTEAVSIILTASGESITVNDSAGRPVNGFEVRGKTEQNGTPSPDNPVPIRSVKTGTKIKVCVKNLFNPLHKNKKLLSGKISTAEYVGCVVSDYIEVTNYNYVAINQGGSFGWYSEKSESSIISFENKSNFVFRCYAKPAGAKYLRLEAPATEPIMAHGVNSVVDNVDAYEPYDEPQELTVPCDLYAGDTWNVLAGEVVRKNDIKEQYEPQTITAPKGTVNVLQEPTDLSADIKINYVADTKTYIDKKFAELQALILEG